MRHTTYYACQPSLSIGRAAQERHPDHPGSIWIREDDLVTGVGHLLTEWVFGPQRNHLLAADLDFDQVRQSEEQEAHIAAVHCSIGQIAERQDRLNWSPGDRHLRTQDDPHGMIFARVRDRLSVLQGELDNKVAELRDLEMTIACQPDIALLQQLPLIEFDLAHVPHETLRDLFDALQLQIRYDRTTNLAHGQVTLVRHGTPAVGEAAQRIQTRDAVTAGDAPRSIVVRAPAGIAQLWSGSTLGICHRAWLLGTAGSCEFPSFGCRSG